MAFHLAQISCFWHAATWLPRPPWGVTANLVLRWWPGLQGFDPRFPKHGGGEDIDICVAAVAAGPPVVGVPDAAAAHPWWDGGRRWSLWARVFRWAVGDGMLLSKYPGFTYQSLPNAVELTVFAVVLAAGAGLVRAAVAVVAAALPVGGSTQRTETVQQRTQDAMQLVLVAWAAVVVGDYLTALGFCVLSGRKWTLARFRDAPAAIRLGACLESATVLQASDLGRVCGFLSRGELRNVCGRRFDWFLGTRPQVAMVAERTRGAVLCAVSAAVFALLWTAYLHFRG